MSRFQSCRPELPTEDAIVERVRRSAAFHPDREAVVCGGRRLNWNAFAQWINYVANHLLVSGNQLVLFHRQLPFSTL